MSIVEKIKGEMKAFNDKKQALVEELRKEFPAILKPLFEKSDKIKSVGWTQYTPYFNDGDECIFRVSNDDLYINDIDYYDLEEDDEVENLHQNFKDVLQEIPEEFYRELFGDHCKVTIFSDGKIEVDEYEHD